MTSSYKKLSSLFVKEERLLSTLLAYFMIITTITKIKKRGVKLWIPKCTSSSKVERAVIVRTEMGTNTHQVQKKENTQMSHFILDLRQATQEVLNLSLYFSSFKKIFP